MRFYVELKASEGLPSESPHQKLSGILFEIQIKTFLQHAWNVTTHDLVYKNDEVSWAKQRIAYQIKAMLEHAEISMDMIENIKESTMLAKSDKRTNRLDEVKKLITDHWEPEALPADLIRLSGSVYFLLDQLKINSQRLGEFLDKESHCGRGTKTLNLSPYFIIIQTIINQDPHKLNSFLANQKSTKKIVIPSEINVNNITLNENKIIRI